MSRWNHPNQGFKKGHKRLRKFYSPLSEEQKKKISISKKGQLHSAETKLKMSLTHKGKPKPWLRGKKHTKEHKESVSLALRGRGLGFKKGNLPWNTGKSRPEISGENHYNWGGGTRRHSSGYIRWYVPNHPFAMDKKYVFQHRLVMEDHLGRYLKPEEKIHHRNGIKDDNRLENLEVVGKPHFGRVCCPFCEKEFLIK